MDHLRHLCLVYSLLYFDVFSVLECKKGKSRSHGKRKNGNI